MSSIYNIGNLLKECILLKDSLLVIALGWLFDDGKISWNFPVQGEYEDDFILETKSVRVLCECKMHLIPKDERSLEGQLVKDLAQWTTHDEALSREGVSFNKVYLIYDYDLTPHLEELQGILDHLKPKGNTKKYRIKPISFPEVTLITEPKE